MSHFLRVIDLYNDAIQNGVPVANHFTLKENTIQRSDLDDFLACYNPKNRHSRKESERFKSFTYEELTKRDKVNLDIFWLKDGALEESANLPAHVHLKVADLERALHFYRDVLGLEMRQRFATGTDSLTQVPAAQ